jgi:hypothetical protein
MPETQKERAARLMPKGIPRYIRLYDGGPQLADRYTCVFTRIVYRSIDTFGRPTQSIPHLGMSANPFHPQGVGLHGDSPKLIDRPSSKHLGRRIEFKKLPRDCQQLVRQDYRDIWGI